MSDTEEKPTRGGRREGAGRPNEGGRKRPVKQIGLLPEVWDKLDRLRGEEPRNHYIEKLILSKREK